jgi:hypothetical protein
LKAPTRPRLFQSATYYDTCPNIFSRTTTVVEIPRISFIPFTMPNAKMRHYCPGKERAVGDIPAGNCKFNPNKTCVVHCEECEVCLRKFPKDEGCTVCLKADTDKDKETAEKETDGQTKEDN